MSDPLIVIEDNTEYYIFEYAISVVVLLFLLYYFFRETSKPRNHNNCSTNTKKKQIEKPKNEENSYPLKQGVYGETVTYFFDSSDDPYASNWREVNGGIYVRDSDKWGDIVNKPVEEDQWEKSALKNIVYYEDNGQALTQKIYNGLSLQTMEGYTNNPTNDHH